jgi:lipopolysaccharide export system protein LptC
MALLRADNLHSRLVFWLKIVLPLAALGLLATLFLFGRPISPEDAIPYASTDITDRVKDPRVTSPVFAAMTNDGAALTITAAEARPGAVGSGTAGLARAMVALMELPDGSTAEVTAPLVQMESAAKRAILTGGVKIVTSSGYTALMPGMSVATTQADLTSLGPVNAEGPPGKLHAETMHLGLAASGGYQLDFTGGVTLVYLPKGGL